MSRIRVVILASLSLFAEGVASRLRRHEARAEVLIVDPHAKDAIGLTVAAKPDAVILDASDPALPGDQVWPLLLKSLPGVRIVDLDSHTQRVRVVTSEEHTADEVRDLVDVIQPPDAMEGVE